MPPRKDHAYGQNPLANKIRANQEARKGARAVNAEQAVNTLKDRRQKEMRQEQAQAAELSQKQVESTKAARELEKEVRVENKVVQKDEEQEDHARMAVKEITGKKSKVVEQQKADQDKCEHQVKQMRHQGEELAADLVGASQTSQTLLERLQQTKDKDGIRRFTQKEQDAKDKVKEIGAKKSANEEQYVATKKRCKTKATEWQTKKDELVLEEKAAVREELEVRNTGGKSNNEKLHHAERDAKTKVKEVNEKQQQVLERQDANKKRFEKDRVNAIRELDAAQGKQPIKRHDESYIEGGHLHVKEAYPYSHKEFDLSKTGQALKTWCTTKNGVVPCEELSLET